MKMLKGLVILAAVSVCVFAISTIDVKPVEASTGVALSIVDMAGNEIPGMVPPHVVVDMSEGVPAASTDWYLLKSIYGTEFLKRLVGASGYIDAGFTATDGLVLTLDFPRTPAEHPCKGGLAYETEDVLIKIGALLTYGPPDAGTSTTLLDVGVSGTTEKFAKDVSMAAAAGTRVIGSQTIIYRQPIGSAGTTDGGIVVTSIRNVDPITTAYRLTITQSAKNLTTATGGRIDVYVKCGPIKERQ